MFSVDDKRVPQKSFVAVFHLTSTFFMMSRPNHSFAIIASCNRDRLITCESQSSAAEIADSKPGVQSGLDGVGEEIVGLGAEF
jgi:hypothetical protein